MRLIRSVPDLRRHVADAKARGARVGLVPTMGALHRGHAALVRAAAAATDEVVVSVFVNPRQFDDPGDFDAYPHDLEADLRTAAEAGAAVVFAPSALEVYPPGFATAVHLGGITDAWEGAARGASHFDGVALVVAKLFGMSAADAAWFGEKDAQQLAVVRRLVADLDIPIEIHGVPTVREDDGLALSSRNVRLSADARARAASLFAALDLMRGRAEAGNADTADLVRAARPVLEAAGVDLDYLAVVDPVTWEPLGSLADAGGLVVVAGRVDDVRLIDNMSLPRVPVGAGVRTGS